MTEARPIDPAATTVEVDGRNITLAEVAAARDHVRAGNLALDPYPMVGIEVRESGAGGGAFTITGHAAVFNKWSLDLGGFREQIAPGAFADVLALNPDVHAVWDHDTRLTLARTKNNTLELREDDDGLYNWMRVAPTSFASDLRVLMERGDIDQQSFAFTIEDDDWEMDEDENVRRTIRSVRDLYDVTITAQGAYPQTSAELERSIRQVLGTDRNLFRIPIEFDTTTTATGTTTTMTTNLPGSDEEPDAATAPDQEGAETRDAAPTEEDTAADSPSQPDEEPSADPAELKARKERIAARRAALKAELSEIGATLEKIDG